MLVDEPTASLDSESFGIVVDAFKMVRKNFDTTIAVASHVPFVAFGLWMHLVLDEIWWNPVVLLWPGYGWGFPIGEEFDLISVLLTPVVLIGEVVGGVILVGFVVWHFRLRRIWKLWESST